MSKKPKNPVSDKKDSNRVNRGDFWYYGSNDLRSAQRKDTGPSYRGFYFGMRFGFRIVKNIPKKEKR